MIKVKDIARLIEEVAPLQLQEDYDNAGYQVGDMENEVTKVVVCLDITESVVDMAIKLGAELIVSHHPLLFRPIKRITPSDYISRTIIKAIQANITLYSAHTNLDNAYKGVNYRIAEMLNLEDIKPLAPLPSHRLCGIANAEMTGSGIIGKLPAVCSAVELVATVKKVFKCESVRTNLNMLSRPSRLITTLALCGGSGADYDIIIERQLPVTVSVDIENIDGMSLTFKTLCQCLCDLVKTSVFPALSSDYDTCLHLYLQKHP